MFGGREGRREGGSSPCADDGEGLEGQSQPLVSQRLDLLAQL